MSSGYLAQQLKINPRTVVKAYEELQSGGLGVRRQGQGGFITDNQGTMPTRVRQKVIADMARRMLAEAARIGASGPEVRAIFNEVLGRMGAGT